MERQLSGSKIAYAKFKEDDQKKFISFKRRNSKWLKDYALYMAVKLYFGNKAWEEGNTQIAEGDEVILKGQLTKYKTTYETSSKKAWVASINGKTE